MRSFLAHSGAFFWMSSIRFHPFRLWLSDATCFVEPSGSAVRCLSAPSLPLRTRAASGPRRVPASGNAVRPVPHDLSPYKTVMSRDTRQAAQLIVICRPGRPESQAEKLDAGNDESSQWPFRCLGAGGSGPGRGHARRQRRPTCAENVEHQNSVQVQHASRLVISSVKDFTVAREMIRRNPKLKELPGIPVLRLSARLSDTPTASGRCPCRASY